MRLLLNIIRWVIVAGLIAVLVLPNAFAFITRATPIQVDGLSMSPTYAVGDIVFISPATSADFVKGTVVTVRKKGGDMYTHRIVSVAGERAQLKGDGNSYEDPTEIKFSDIAGAVRAHAGGLPGQVLSLLFKWPVRIFLLVFIVALTFLPLSRDRGRHSDDVEVAEPAGEDATPIEGHGELVAAGAASARSGRGVHSARSHSATTRSTRKHSARKDPS